MGSENFLGNCTKTNKVGAEGKFRELRNHLDGKFGAATFAAAFENEAPLVGAHP